MVFGWASALQSSQVLRLPNGGILPVLPTAAYSQAEDALTLARALVNDSAGVVFADTLPMPLLNSAYRGQLS